jgi:hypothetical protein
MVLPINGSLSALQYWTQSNLPAVYEDSLSYYELLSKVISQLNTNTDFANGLKDSFNALFTDQWIETKNLKNGIVTADKIDPNIMSQPTTEIGVQAKLDDIDNQIDDITVNVKRYNIISDGVTDQTQALIDLFTTGGLKDFKGVILIPFNTKFNISQVFPNVPVSAIVEDHSNINMYHSPTYNQKYINVGGSDKAENDFVYQIISGHHPALVLNNLGTSGSGSADQYFTTILGSHGFNPDGTQKSHAYIQLNTDGTSPIGGGNGKWRYIFYFENKYSTNETTGYTAFQIDEEGFVNMRAKKVYWRTISGATPDVSTGEKYFVSNAAATDMTNLLSNLNQEVTLVFQDGNTTLKQGLLKLQNSVDWTPTPYSSITLVKNSGVTGAWIEVARSQK